MSDAKEQEHGRDALDLDAEAVKDLDLPSEQAEKVAGGDWDVKQNTKV